MRTSTISKGLVVLALGALAIQPAGAQVIKKSFDFSLETWHEIDGVSGAVTLHRIQISTKGKAGSKLSTPLNAAYIQPVISQLEYTNTGDKKWRADVQVNWVDEDGKVIDGFRTTYPLAKQTARKIHQSGLTTSKYGLDRAVKLDVTITVTP